MVKVFISYSHKDESLKNELDTHLTSLKRKGLISVWHDRRIIPGQELNDVIDENLESSEIILLLVSPDFIASDYCYNVEMDAALGKHRDGSAVVIPVILRPCDWQDLPFGNLTAATTDGKAIVKFPNPDDGFLEVVESIKKNIQHNFEGETKKLAHTTGSNSVGIKEHIRSGNLRVKEEFTDKDYEDFEQDAFEYLSTYIENSILELEKRNPDIDGSLRRIDANTFTVKIYQKGKDKSSCTVSLSKGKMFPSGITFSYGINSNSYSESLTVEDDGYMLYLKPIGMSSFGRDSDKKLTKEGASEYFWELIIQPLQ